MGMETNKKAIIKQVWVCLFITLFTGALVAMEIGMLTISVLYGWGGFGDPSLIYTPFGDILKNLVLCIIPVIMLILLIRAVHKRIKGKPKEKQSLLISILHVVCAVCGASLAFTKIFGVFFLLGGWTLQFLIQTFGWMCYPIP